MTRHDYRRAYRAVSVGDLVARAALPQLRAPVAALAVALLAIVTLWSFEAQRIATLDRAITELQQRSAGAARDAGRAQRLLAAVDRERSIAARIVHAHRIAIASTNAVAQIGNALHGQTWLTTLTAAPSGGWLISGRSTRVAEIGATLRAIAALDPHAATHLQTIAATGRDGRLLDFVIGWEQRP